jgi:hypothetical protein
MQKILAAKEFVKVKTYQGAGNRHFSGGNSRNPGKVFYSLLQLISQPDKKGDIYKILLATVTYQIDSILRKNKISDVKDLSKDDFKKYLLKEIKRSSPRNQPKKIIAVFTDIGDAKAAFSLRGKMLK